MHDGVLQWKVRITDDMLDEVKSSNLVTNCTETIHRLLDVIVDPVICFSGGIDSQTVIDSFLIAGITPKIVIFNYDDFNHDDVSHAVKFCDSRGISYHIVDIDIIRFLSSELYEFATRYGISSPQFATHLFATLKMKELGYNSAIFGGNNLCQFEDYSWYIPTKEETDWYEFSRKNNFPILGNFWVHDWKLSLFATLEMPFFRKNDKPHNYRTKIEGYRRMGFDIVPQSKKLNGFEKIKSFYEESTGDGWAFENAFRYPLVSHNGQVLKMLLDIDPEIFHRINSIKINKELSPFLGD